MCYTTIPNINFSLYRNIRYKINLTLYVVTHLKFKFGAAKVGPLLLPKVVRLNDEGNVDAGWERLLKDLQ